MNEAELLAELWRTQPEAHVLLWNDEGSPTVDVSSDTAHIQRGNLRDAMLAALDIEEVEGARSIEAPWRLFVMQGIVGSIDLAPGERIVGASTGWTKLPGGGGSMREVPHVEFIIATISGDSILDLISRARERHARSEGASAPLMMKPDAAAQERREMIGWAEEVGGQWVVRSMPGRSGCRPCWVDPDAVVE